MSALPPKADKQTDASGCPLSAPKADIRAAAKKPLFHHLVGAGEQSCRHLDAERLRGLQVDDRLFLVGACTRIQAAAVLDAATAHVRAIDGMSRCTQLKRGAFCR
jgi:hypothetical protein